MKAAEWLEQASKAIDSLDAQALLACAMGISRAALIARPEALVPDGAHEMLARRIAGEPLAYILGWKEFYGRRFSVSSAVLVPRPETETLIDACLKASIGGTCLDVGTGCGAIALTLALEAAGTRWLAIDISHAALEVTRSNAQALGARISLARASRLDSIMSECADAVVSNPPYVAHDDPRLERDVREHEPPEALFAEDGGMAFIAALAYDAMRALRRGGLLAIEFGAGQESRVEEALEGYKDVRIVADLSGMPRVATARKP